MVSLGLKEKICKQKFFCLANKKWSKSKISAKSAAFLKCWKHHKLLNSRFFVDFLRKCGHKHYKREEEAFCAIFSKINFWIFKKKFHDFSIFVKSSVFEEMLSKKGWKNVENKVGLITSVLTRILRTQLSSDKLSPAHTS